jgi:hypothetical protein|uniref:Uncharacterized protein n=2 Tax=Picea TaxID=3328 RepID=A0A117NGN6_PICGL|nr:hypothetical protein ABT39_MTgene6081 [Picea glauca]
MYMLLSNQHGSQCLKKEPYPYLSPMKILIVHIQMDKLNVYMRVVDMGTYFSLLSAMWNYSWRLWKWVWVQGHIPEINLHKWHALRPLVLTR